jgi:serine/threonine protein kinase
MKEIGYCKEEVLIERYPFVVLNRNLSGSPSSKIRLAIKLDDVDHDPPDHDHQDQAKLYKKKYAVKQILKWPLSDLQWSNLMRGIGIHKYLSSVYPGVVQLYDVIEDERYFYLIMEALDGDLVSMLEYRRTALSEEEARDVFKQTVRIVEFLHEKDIVHRDLKLDNFMIYWDSPEKKNKVVTVKLSDFDFADYVKEGNSLVLACGTPPYTAPELCEEDPIYDGKKSDIWSLGILLYVLVCGSFPWFDMDVCSLFKKIRLDPLVLPHHLSPDLCDLLSKLLEKDPKRRISIPDIMTHTWLDQRPTSLET